MKTEKTPNFTETQEARIREVASEQSDGKLNGALAAQLADEFGKSSRSVIAKITRMGVPYATKAPVTKTGEPVRSKEKIVAEIGAVVSGNLEGLEKAPKEALKAVAAFVASTRAA